MKSYEILKRNIFWKDIFLWDSNGRTIFGLLRKCALVSTLISFCLTTFWYFLTEARSFDEYVDGFFFLLLSILTLGWYLIFFSNRKNIIALINDFDGIVQKRFVANQMIYEPTDDKVHEMTSIVYMVYMIVAFIYTFCSVIKSIVNILALNESNEFQQFYPASLPFDWESPAGYVACLAIQIPTLFIAGYVVLLVTGFTIFQCIFVVDLVIDIQRNLSDLDNLILGGDEEPPMAVEKRIKIIKKLIGIIEFHSTSRRFTNRFAETIRHIVLAYLIYIGASLCCLLLKFFSLLADANIYAYQPIISGISLLSLLFTFCYFGDRVTQHYEDVGDNVYALQWYMLPSDVQKGVPLMIALAQKRIYIRGFGDTTHFTLDVFKKIMKTTFSYFMVLKRFLDVTN